MKENRIDLDIKLLRDRRADASERADAARRLARSRAQGALEALIAVAEEPDADEGLARAAGESVAKMVIRTGKLDKAPLHDFSDCAYLAYDETMSRHLRSASA